MFERPSISQDYVRVPVDAEEAGLPVDPSGLPVELAFTNPDTDPGPGDWAEGEWEQAGDSWLARIIPTLAKGYFQVWVKITGNPETAVLDCGLMQST